MKVSWEYEIPNWMEKNMFQTTNQAKDIHIKSYLQSLRPTCSSVTNNSDDDLG